MNSFRIHHTGRGMKYFGAQGHQAGEPAHAPLLLPALRQEGDDPDEPRQEEDQGEQRSLHR